MDLRLTFTLAQQQQFLHSEKDDIEEPGHMVSYTRTIRISPHCLKPVVNGLAPGAAVNENPV